MRNNRKPQAERPVPAPKGQDQLTLEELTRAIDRAVVALNGALNITSAALKRSMDEGFRKLEELITTMRP